MVNGAGAEAGSPLVATVVELYGTSSFMPTIASVLFTTSGFVLYRMSARSAVPAEAQGSFVAIPDSSLGVAVTLNPEAEWVTGEGDSNADDPFKDNPYVN